MPSFENHGPYPEFTPEMSLQVYYLLQFCYSVKENVSLLSLSKKDLRNLRDMFIPVNSGNYGPIQEFLQEIKDEAEKTKHQSEYEANIIAGYEASFTGKVPVRRRKAKS